MNPFFPNQIIAFAVAFALWFVAGAFFTALVLHFAAASEQEEVKRAHRKVILGFGIAVGLIGAMVWMSRLPSN
jgi:hypothetical protein